MADPGILEGDFHWYEILDAGVWGTLPAAKEVLIFIDILSNEKLMFSYRQFQVMGSHAVATTFNYLSVIIHMYNNILHLYI